MIDSLNLMVKEVWFVDFNNLIKVCGTFAKKYLHDAGNSVQIGYSFKYKNIDFKYSKNFGTLLLMANPHKLLSKKDITLSDKDVFKEIVIQALRDVLQTDKFIVEVNRIDYYVDIFVNEKMKEYISLLKRHKGDFNRMKKQQYKTSSYFKSEKGKGQIRLNFYDKYAESGKEIYKGILRLEIQNRPAKIKNEYKKHNISKQIDVYWSKDCMEVHYFEVIEKYLYLGTYFKRETCKKLINKSELSKRKKKNINRFSLLESRYKIEGVLTRKKFSSDTINNYIKKLNELNINPVTIPEESKYQSLENLVVLARAVAEESYFK